MAAIGVACGPVSVPPPAPVTVNDGCPNQCADYTLLYPSPGAFAQCVVVDGTSSCVDKSITNETAFSFVVVLSMPETYEPEVYAPGTNFVVTLAELAASGGTFTLPQPTAGDGTYLVTPSITNMVGRNLYWQPLPMDVTGTPYVSLPVEVTYWPTWVQQGASCTDAACLGLPLPPIPALIVSPPDWPAGDSKEPVAEGVGGNTNNIIGWAANLPPLPAGGSYTRVVTVDAPFDDAFPPDINPAFPQPFDDVLNVSGPLPTPSPPPSCKSQSCPMNLIVPAGMTVEGWTVYVQDESSGRRVSNLVTVHGDGQTAPVSLFFAQAEPPNGWYVYAVPPTPGSPTWLTQILLGGSFDITYPTLSANVQVSGFVTAPDRAPTSATLHFQSTNITAALELTYAVDVATDDLNSKTGTLGHYEVSLPPGTYTVLVTPSDPTLALSTPTAMVPAMSPPAGGIDLQVDERVTLTGRFTVNDGPLVGADVEATPAVSLAQSTTGGPPPRTATALTASDGSFTMQVDPGVYDVTAKPPAGSRLPWIVVPEQTVTAGTTTTLPAIVVPAPVLEPMTFVSNEQGFGVGIAGIIVRAYAFSTMDGTAHEIASGITDAAGHVDLFLTGLSSP